MAREVEAPEAGPGPRRPRWWCRTDDESAHTRQHPNWREVAPVRHSRPRLWPSPQTGTTMPHSPSLGREAHHGGPGRGAKHRLSNCRAPAPSCAPACSTDIRPSTPARHRRSGAWWSQPSGFSSSVPVVAQDDAQDRAWSRHPSRVGLFYHQGVPPTRGWTRLPPPDLDQTTGSRLIPWTLLTQTTRDSNTFRIVCVRKVQVASSAVPVWDAAWAKCID